ncbi:hypothetical protein A6V39_03935 [Candidatus Mycoplasma haematobovis]|uniref:Uncharacterized protein n=1 Tax=Candidatus Mycoplasma haematobovis TaxID=432608 RepID=A0A1A9QCS8_9MOLU|nr:hypothetical protein [Candidatus Mycoplasma haematobovis]OAL10038.1 hypothetical protein A6V39_03935 [Candidatus Mycoplasma haematobovis]
MFNSGFAVKSAIGIVTVGTLGGAGYGVYSYNNTTDTVRNYLKKNNLTVIEKTNSTFWTKVLETYKLEKTQELSISVENNVTAENIRDWCDTNLKTNIDSTDNSLFKKASRWCVDYQTIEEQLTSAKFQTDTKELAKKYSSITDTTIKGQIDKSVISGGNNNSEGDKIKRWCDSNKKRRFSSDDKVYSSNIETICLKA